MISEVIDQIVIKGVEYCKQEENVKKMEDAFLSDNGTLGDPPDAPLGLSGFYSEEIYTAATVRIPNTLVAMLKNATR